MKMAEVSEALLDEGPLDSVTLSWENVRVVLPPKKKLLFLRKGKPPTEILKGVSGIVKPGALLAIMGASGSGKTTLLNVLTQRNLQNVQTSGQVRVNGINAGPADIASLSAYVQQEDLFVGVLTVRQHLWFQAMLRMDPKKTTDQQRQRRIDQVIRDLGLTKCQNSVIGIPNKVKSLSGGERKRLAFASEILTNPALMFCDEPTSGLDSFMAESVVVTLKNLASSGRTIVCTIHQPSSEIFALFDNLLLLADGHLMYMGPSAGARSFFTSAGFPCPQDFNPSDYYIRTLAIKPGNEDESQERLNKIHDCFRASDQGRKLSDEIAGASNKTQSSRELLDLSKRSRFKANYFQQLRLVFWRSWLSANHDAMVVGIRFAQNILIALLAGLIFLGQNNDQKGVQNINGAIFMMCANITFGNAFAVIMLFTAELPLFKRDNENGTYRTSVYYICKSVADLPIFILNPIIFTSILYWMTGFRPDLYAYLICVTTSVVLTNVVVAFGCMISCLAGELSIAQALSGPVLVPFIIFGGVLLNDASIPSYFLWMGYLSWYKYANEIYLINQWHNFGEIGCEFEVPIPSTQHPIVMTPPPWVSGEGGGVFDTIIGAASWFFGGGSDHVNATSSFDYAKFYHGGFGNSTGNVPPFAAFTSRCFKDGEAVLQAYSYNADKLMLDFICLVALFVGFRIIGLVALLLRANPISIAKKKSNGGLEETKISAKDVATKEV